MRELTYNDKIIITSAVLGLTTFAALLYKFHAFRRVFTETIPNSIINNYNSMSAGISQFLLELYSDSNLMSAYLTYFAVYAAIIVFTIFFYLYNTDATLFSKKTFVSSKPLLFFALILLPLIKVLYFTSTDITGGSTSTNTLIIIGVIGFTIVSSMLYYLYNYFSKQQLLIIGDIITLIVLLCLIIVLAMFSIIFNNNLKMLTGWGGFAVYLIFYIPCLLVRFIEYIKSEVNSTTNTIFILFLLEICFILSYLYLPRLINIYLNKGGNPLLEGSRFLDKEYALTTGAELKALNKQQLLIANVVKPKKSSDQNFSISMWIYVNAQPPSNSAYVKEANIFNYSNENTNSISNKPQIVYNYHAKKNKVKKYKIYFTNETSTTNENTKNYHRFSLPEQKWNNIVINYTSNIVDLFINGNLESSFAFAPNYHLPKYEDSDVIKIGNDNGLYGSICNVRYYYNTLSKSEIVNQYNLLMSKNPPINTI